MNVNVPEDAGLDDLMPPHPPAAAAAATEERERMERLVVRLLAERLIYIPELGEFDLPHSIDVKEMPSKAVEALVRYGPYCGGGHSMHHKVATRTLATAMDTLYLVSNLEPWSRIIAEATARRRT